MNNQDKCMLTVIMLIAIGLYVLIFEYMSLPKSEEYNAINNRMIGQPKITNESRIFEFNVGNGYMSNIEHIISHLCLIMGIFRLRDWVRN